MGAPQLAAPQATIDQSIFEGLFTRVLKPEGAFAADLVAIGYDPRRPEPRYPIQVWKQALEVACRHVAPALPQPAAMEKLGRMFIAGFYQTIIGKVIATISPFLSAELLMKRLPKFVAMGSSAIQARVAAEGPGVWLLTLEGPHPVPEFVLGTLRGDGNKLFTSIDLVGSRVDSYDIRFVAAKR